MSPEDRAAILAVATGGALRAPDAPFQKHDVDKPRPDLIHSIWIEGTATVLAFGAKKYAPDNWLKAHSYRRYFSPLMRHLWAWFRGEDRDAESGHPHLWHAACCLMYLMAFEDRIRRGVEPATTDDRSKDGSP